VDAGDLALMMALLLRPIPGLRAGPDIQRLPDSGIGLADFGGA
jgi:hypothetical protein